MLKRIFTENEISYAKRFSDSFIHFASMWCVKEAFIKATSEKNISLKSIEIAHKDDGKPYIEKNETISKILKTLGFTDIKISISNADDYSTAVCLIY